jgi:methionine-rich copper-binding protein CopC
MAAACVKDGQRHRRCATPRARLPDTLQIRGKMMRLQSNFVMGLALAVVLALSVSPARAHAILVQSTPAVNSTVDGPKIDFALQFNSRIDSKRSLLTLTLPNKSTRVLPIVEGAAPDVLKTAAELPPGAYSLRWQVLATDGHITRGDVPFSVTAR